MFSVRNKMFAKRFDIIEIKYITTILLCISIYYFQKHYFFKSFIQTILIFIIIYSYLVLIL